MTSSNQRGAEESEALREFFATQKYTRQAWRDAAEAAEPALTNLCEMMRMKTGQGYAVRGLLWSLYNGAPVSLINVLDLDYAVRKDVCSVVMGFGFEGPGLRFFYDAMEAAVTEAGLWEWFSYAGSEVEA